MNKQNDQHNITINPKKTTTTILSLEVTLTPTIKMNLRNTHLVTDNIKQTTLNNTTPKPNFPPSEHHTTNHTQHTRSVALWPLLGNLDVLFFIAKTTVITCNLT